MKAQENGESVKAIQLYEQVLDNNPNHFSALFEITDLYWESQKFDKAVDIYTRAFKVNPVRTGAIAIKLWTRTTARKKIRAGRGAI
ncbi:MAG: tetratricopeptide repeat protein [Hormoscilla sp. GM102CHS1]|nr:tetratricopeptide repeat protein [Hormoscilla sp. GM102CHS1]MBC6475245.1 tetratricopeptide repeat protein [Hormoscilla sp. GM102CHS1]